MTTTSQTFVERLEAFLPARHGRIRGVTVFDEAQRAARFEHPSYLGQGRHEIGNRAQRPREENCIEGVRGRIQGLAIETGDLDGGRELGDARLSLPMASRLTPLSASLVCDDPLLIDAAEQLLGTGVLPSVPVYGVPMRLAWKKHRMRCMAAGCPMKTWVLQDHRIAAKSCLLTTRAAKWATIEVGTERTVLEVAGELDCDWHTVNDAVTTYGAALLEADRRRMNRTEAIGLDETAFVKAKHRLKDYATTVVDVEHHQIIEILPSRNFVEVAGWLDKQPGSWKERIRFGALDMSDTYAAVYSVVLPKAAQVVDPFHAVALANRALDQVRRRVQTEQTGHRGRKDDPLYRARRVLLVAEEKLDDEATERLASLLELGDPNAEVAIAYRVKERVRDFYRTNDPASARRLLDELMDHCLKKAMPPEIQRLGKTIKKWFEKLCNYHLAKVTNGPTEALNNLIKRIKRVGFGFRNFENYRIRALLYAGKPNWRVLGSIVVR